MHTSSKQEEVSGTSRWRWPRDTRTHSEKEEANKKIWERSKERKIALNQRVLGSSEIWPQQVPDFPLQSEGGTSERALAWFLPELSANPGDQVSCLQRSPEQTVGQYNGWLSGGGFCWTNPRRGASVICGIAVAVTGEIAAIATTGWCSGGGDRQEAFQGRTGRHRWLGEEREAWNLHKDQSHWRTASILVRAMWCPGVGPEEAWPQVSQSTRAKKETPGSDSEEKTDGQSRLLSLQSSFWRTACACPSGFPAMCRYSCWEQKFLRVCPGWLMLEHLLSRHAKLEAIRRRETGWLYVFLRWWRGAAHSTRAVLEGEDWLAHRMQQMHQRCHLPSLVFNDIFW